MRKGNRCILVVRNIKDHVYNATDLVMLFVFWHVPALIKQPVREKQQERRQMVSTMFHFVAMLLSRLII